MTQPWYEELSRASRHIRSAERVVVLTGAGISVASGIPDFRSPGGLWERYDPQKVCSTWALHNNPEGVWEFLLDALHIFGKARPNPAHLALARLEEQGRLSGIITQNIDNLHQQAGSGKVIDFHGNFRCFYCMGCRQEHASDQALRLTEEDVPWFCDCGGLVRPDVVFFGEQIPPVALQESLRMAAAADCVLIVGTSGEVAPANTFPFQIKSRGGIVLELNLGPTNFANLSDVRIDGRAEEVLPVLTDLVLQ